MDRFRNKQTGESYYIEFDFSIAVNASLIRFLMASYILSDWVPTIDIALFMSAEFFSASANIVFCPTVYFVESSESSTYIVPTG